LRFFNSHWLIIRHIGFIKIDINQLILVG